MVVTMMNFSQVKLFNNSYQVDPNCNNYVFKLLLPVGVTLLQRKQNEDVHLCGLVSIVRV